VLVLPPFSLFFIHGFIHGFLDKRYKCDILIGTVQVLFVVRRETEGFMDEFIDFSQPTIRR
jgi:hypothetical protein